MRAAPVFLLASMTTLFLGCTDSTAPSLPAIQAPEEPESRAFRITPSLATIRGGESIQFAAGLSGDPVFRGGASTTTWSSTNPAVATVSSSGLVHGVSGGETRIVASWGGHRATASVRVTAPWKKNPRPPVCLERTTGADHDSARC